MSHAMVYSPSKAATTEEGKVEPWTIQARARYDAENELKAIAGLNLATLRPVNVYGPGDVSGLMPRVCCAAVYQKNKKKMEFLWGSGLLINCVHVRDVCAAIWATCVEAKVGAVYNLADNTKLTQGIMNDALKKIFKLKTGFYGTIMSNLAKTQLDSVAAKANGDHVPGWSKLAREHKILNTPITPFLDKELLYNNHLSINGSKIAKELPSFTYAHPVLTAELLREQVQFAIDQKIFPPVLLP
jgi:nucleoside-diphosphate-sugar epimerase